MPSRLAPTLDYLPEADVLLDDDLEEAWQAFAKQVEDTFVAADKAQRDCWRSRADLDRPGADNLFGAAQAEHPRIIGTELYQHLLAVAAAGRSAAAVSRS